MSACLVVVGDVTFIICIYACLYICVMLLKVYFSTSFLHDFARFLIRAFFSLDPYLPFLIRFMARVRVVIRFMARVRVVIRFMARVRVRHWWYATGLGLGLDTGGTPRGWV